MPQKPPFMSAADVRRAFLEFFRERGHTVVPSSSLVPGNDPTLLFTNAGMVQFKDCFLGKEKRDYVRAVSSQRCVRAGGKHNDLENVGYTARHHTFFEMLGNFSFGDYFKKDAIRFGWDFVTKTLQIDPARLMVTVYATDDEAFDIWHKEVGVPADKIVRIGDKPGGGSDNFWQMGETGPCGPCSEIFFDHGAQIPGGPPGSPDADGDRWVEIWNLVFMQFDRSTDGKLTPLPKPSVDTGAGLERVSAVMQGVTNNYDIDLFKNLIHEAAARSEPPISPTAAARDRGSHPRLHVPRRRWRHAVERRPRLCASSHHATRHAPRLQTWQQGRLLLQARPTLAEEMGSAYPELVAKQAVAARNPIQGGRAIRRTLETGMEILCCDFEDDYTRYGYGKFDGSSPDRFKRWSRKRDAAVIDGDTVFKLYDTYGFPIDLTADIARERGFRIDMRGTKPQWKCSANALAPPASSVWTCRAASGSKARRISSATRRRRTSARWSRCSRAARRCKR